MNYVITNLIEVSKGLWTCDVEYWRNCRCGSQNKKVEIQSEQRPSKVEIINAINQ